MLRPKYRKQKVADEYTSPATFHLARKIKLFHLLRPYMRYPDKLIFKGFKMPISS